MRVFVPCLAAFFVGLSAGPVMADERVEICYNYGCLVRVEVVFSELRLVEIAGRLRLADSANTPVHLPVPGRELAVLQKPLYTFGGGGAGDSGPGGGAALPLGRRAVTDWRGSAW